MSTVETTISYAADNKQRYLGELIAFLRIPSISALSDHKQDINDAARWVSSQLRDIGVASVEVIATEGHPIVYGSLINPGEQLPTILVYGHYDVQPIDPLDEWQSAPFNPHIRGDNIYARGATDMKAQIVALLKAVEAVIRTSQLPVNLKFLFEGEEEIGSPSLGAFISENKELLDCDFCLNLDAGILAPDVPSIMYALRGLAYFEIHLQGPSADLHSGKFGGAIENPALVLCELIAGMRDKQGCVTLPGFYDQVQPLTKEQLREISELPQTNEWWLEQSGANALRQDDQYNPTARATARPALDVNGIVSGFTGEGSKTVLPAQAMAKISMRLVPNQTPEGVRKNLDDYLAINLPATVKLELIEMHGCVPSVMNRESPAVQAARYSLETVFGKPPLFTRDGGSVPVVGLIQELLGADTLLLGFGLPDDNPHAPNEKQHLPTFFRGIETYIYFLNELAGFMR